MKLIINTDDLALIMFAFDVTRADYESDPNCKVISELDALTEKISKQVRGEK